MSSVDHSIVSSTDGRKRWETPSVILGTARGNTRSSINTLGPDGVSAGPTASSYGS